MNYAAYLRTDHWNDIRAAKLHEVNDRCQSCRRRSKLQVHHLTYERIGNERLSDLKVLCERCHEKTHNLFPVFVDDWKPAISKTHRKKRPKPVREKEGDHPLFKYVKPILDGKIYKLP